MMRDFNLKPNDFTLNIPRNQKKKNILAYLKYVTGYAKSGTVIDQID